MYILMPAGFLLLLAALMADRQRLHWAAICAGLTAFPSCLFFALGLLGMVLMVVFTLYLSSADPKTNWLEQGGNGAAQLCFFLRLTLLP